jgi:hypothetical protein
VHHNVQETISCFEVCVQPADWRAPVWLCATHIRCTARWPACGQQCAVITKDSCRCMACCFYLCRLLCWVPATAAAAASLLFLRNRLACCRVACAGQDTQWVPCTCCVLLAASVSSSMLGRLLWVLISLLLLLPC